VPQEDDGVGREPELGHVVLAVVLRVRIAVSGRRVETHAVVAIGLEVADIRVGVAAAVADIHQDVGSLGGRLYRGPRSIWRVDLGDVGCVLGEGIGRAIGAGLPTNGVRADGAHDDDDFCVACSSGGHCGGDEPGGCD